MTLLAVECAGNLHALTVARLVARYGGVFVLACAMHRCRSREGVWLSRARLQEGREPKLRQPLDPTRVHWASGSAADLAVLVDEFDAFAGAGTHPRRRSGWRRRALAVALTLAGLAIVAWLSQVPAGATPAHSALRLAWRLPGQSVRDCRPLSAAEIARQPVHMRVTEDCRTVYLDYDLRVWIDGKPRLETIVAPLGARSDRPLYVAQDMEVTPGAHGIRLEFVPRGDPSGQAIRLEYEGIVHFEAGRARLLTRPTSGAGLRLVAEDERTSP